jgi:hypothetical protein
MGYRASNARDRDAAGEWRRLPLADKLLKVNWRAVPCWRSSPPLSLFLP